MDIHKIVLALKVGFPGLRSVNDRGSFHPYRLLFDKNMHVSISRWIDFLFNAFIALIVCFSGSLIHQWSAAWAALENFLSLAHVGDCAFMALKIRISSATLLRSKYRSDVCFWGLPLAFGFAFHCLFYLLWELKSNLYSATERSMTASFNYLPLALISHSCSDLSWLLHPEHSGQFHGDANAAWFI